MEEEEEFVVLLRRNWLPPERREIEPVSELLLAYATLLVFWGKKLGDL